MAHPVSQSMGVNPPPPPRAIDQFHNMKKLVHNGRISNFLTAVKISNL